MHGVPVILYGGGGDPGERPSVSPFHIPCILYEPYVHYGDVRTSTFCPDSGLAVFRVYRNVIYTRIVHAVRECHVLKVVQSHGPGGG